MCTKKILNGHLNRQWDKKKNTTTIVTSYYEIGSHSKHGSRKYDEWIPNFLATIEAPIVIYTDRTAVDKIITFRGNKPMKIVVLPLWEVPVLKMLKEEFEGNQIRLDPERKIHSADLYAIWTAKSWMLSETARLNPFKSDFFFWVDIGSFREQHRFKYWPDPERVREVVSSSKNRMVLGLINQPLVQDIMRWSEKDGPYSSGDFVEGTFFGSTADTIHWWSNLYYDLVYQFMKHGFFVGKDQSVMNAAAMMHRDKIAFIDTKSQSCKDPWFYFQQYFASSSELAGECEHEREPLGTWDTIAVT